MSTTVTPELQSKFALRSVFACEGESLVLVIARPGEQEGLADLVGAVEGLRRGGTPLRLIVYGDSSVSVEGSKLSAVGFLESWAEPLLPEVLGLADVVVTWGKESQALLANDPEGLRTLPILHRPDIAGGISELCGKILEALPLKDPPASSAPRPPAQSLDTFVLQNDWGIGDELLLSAVARELNRAHPELKIWIRSRFGFRFPMYVRRDPVPENARVIDTIYQNLSLYGPAAHSPFPRHLVQQMLDKFAHDTGIQVKAQDLRPELEPVAPPLAGLEKRSVVLNSRPNPRLPSKDWGVERWVKLTALLRAAGITVRQVGSKDETVLADVEDLRGVPIPQLPEVLARSGVVVTVVGLLMHVAEATRTPAVVIYGGREHPAIDGYPDQIHLSARPLPCRGRWGCHLAPDLECPHGMKCMDHLTPELVAGEILSVLGQEVAR